ncbi:MULTISPECIES: hypothetical protein [Enterobacteriaceae]|uniref:Uncharacterized protein n=1 Tax=Klebsiella pneumoniae TaxID=573 RepID=A0A3G1IEB5_KLEPN|nr:MULTISPECIES: hypothetical protein [Enterobacteriaceae]ASF89376.1 hypothetical protein pPUTH1_0257 [Klebsiella pneumoniae]MCF2758042.1 hypothetical protein [Klebsiella pneumoniae]MCM2248325.1 hypothetical protein [Klebsiella pneumoniae]MCM5849564.1 hypothetical protein [Klebsiella pneumoniae]MCM5946555.1 hypothetical protein [Klebsiella pneumoniae]
MTVKVELPNFPSEGVHVIEPPGLSGQGLDEIMRELGYDLSNINISDFNLNPLDTILSQGEQN